MHPHRVRDERIAVQYPDGRYARSATPTEARQMIRAGVAYAPRTRGSQIRCIILHEGPSRPVAGTKYSHAADRPDNPRGVWALRHLPIHHPDREMRQHVFLCFRAALVECGAEVVGR